MQPIMSRKRHSRDLSLNEKLYAVQRIEAGESKASVARKINVPESTLRGWCKNSNKLLLKLSENNDLSFATNIPPEQQIEHKVAQNFVSNERPTHDYTNGKSRGGLGVIDLTNNLDEPLQEPLQSYEISQSKGTVSPSMNLTRSNLHSVPGMNDFQSRGPYSPYADTVFNYPRDSRFFYPNQPIVRSQNSYNSVPSPVLTSLASHGSSPSLPMPSVSMTAQTVSPTPALNDAKQSMFLWQAHNFNRSLIERMADKSPTNFNNNIYTPEDLTFRRSLVVQPIQRKIEHGVSLSTPSTHKPSEINTEKQDSFSNTLVNINNNVVEQESDAGITELLEAIQNAEKFSKWFDTYSDPTITTQDVLRFENLLGKVRKIVERKSNSNVQSSKNRKRK